MPLPQVQVGAAGVHGGDRALLRLRRAGAARRVPRGLPLRARRQGRGVIENNTRLKSNLLLLLRRPSVCVSIHPEGESRSDLCSSDCCQ